MHGLPNSLHLLQLCVNYQPIRKKKLSGCVSDNIEGGQAQMALPKAGELSRRDFLRRAGQTALGAAAALTLPPAQDAEAAGGISDRDAGQLLDQAGQYSDAGQGVAVLAFVGDDGVNQGYSPEMIGEGLVKLLREQGANAQAFVAYNGSKPTAISFLTLNNGFGPMGIGDALKAYPQAVAEFKREREVAPLLKSSLD